jgi:hypothetical protein
VPDLVVFPLNGGLHSSTAIAHLEHAASAVFATDVSVGGVHSWPILQLLQLLYADVAEDAFSV